MSSKCLIETEIMTVFFSVFLFYRMVNNPVFQWKSLRLLARQSPHFFGQNNTPAMPLPQYLELMLRKIAQELPSMGTNGEGAPEQNHEEMRTEVGDDEAIKESQEAEEEELKAQAEDAGIHSP